MLQGKKRKTSSQGQARMYVAKDDSAAAAFNQGRSMQGLQEVPLGQRATSTSGRDSIVTARCASSLSLHFAVSLLSFSNKDSVNMEIVKTAKSRERKARDSCTLTCPYVFTQS